MLGRPVLYPQGRLPSPYFGKYFKTDLFHPVLRPQVARYDSGTQDKLLLISEKVTSHIKLK